MALLNRPRCVFPTSDALAHRPASLAAWMQRAPREAARPAPLGARPGASRLACKAEAKEAKSGVADKSAGRMMYRPQTFSELVDDSVASILAALDSGITKMEVDYPPLPDSMGGTAQ